MPSSSLFEKYFKLTINISRSVIFRSITPRLNLHTSAFYTRGYMRTTPIMYIAIAMYMGRTLLTSRWPSAVLKYTVFNVWYGHKYSKNMDQPSKVADPARGQLNREKWIFPCPRSRPRIWSRETGSAAASRVGLLISIPRLNLVLTHGIPPDFHSGVHLFILNRHTPSGQSRVLSGHAIAYRWRLLPRVHRHRASNSQGSSKRVLPWQVTMDQFICASLSHTH